MSNNGEFARFIAEFGSKEEVSAPREKQDKIEATDDVAAKAGQNASASTRGRKSGSAH